MVVADDGCEAGCVVLSALLVEALPEEGAGASELAEATGADDEDATVAGILASAPLLFICSNQGLAVYDSHSWDCVAFRSHSGTTQQRYQIQCLDENPGRAESLEHALWP